jgi:hypothetical protein
VRIPFLVSVGLLALGIWMRRSENEVTRRNGGLILWLAAIVGIGVFLVIALLVVALSANDTGF